MPVSTDPIGPPSRWAELDVQGALPQRLSGRFVAIGTDGLVHSVDVRGGRATYTAGHSTASTVVHSTASTVACDLVVVNDSVVAVGADFSVHELSTDAGSRREVDLAGRGRALAACPRPDPITGELHLVARHPDGAQDHVVITARALTRRSRPITAAPARIENLALGVDHVVYVADGVVGVAPRNGEPRTTWIATDAAAPRPIHTYRSADTVVLLGLTPSLERWTLHADAEPVQRDVLDPAPRRYALVNGVDIDGVPRSVWTTGDHTISRHDLAEARTTRVDLTPSASGDFVLIPAQRPTGSVDDGWFVGVVHDASGTTAALRVIDMAGLTGPCVATVRLPGAITPGLRCAWLPSTLQ